MIDFNVLIIWSPLWLGMDKSGAFLLLVHIFFWMPYLFHVEFTQIRLGLETVHHLKVHDMPNTLFSWLLNWHFIKFSNFLRIIIFMSIFTDLFSVMWHRKHIKLQSSRGYGAYTWQP